VFLDAGSYEVGMTKQASPLRMARARQQKTLREVQQETRISIGRLSMLERNMARCSERERDALAAALGVEVSALFP
jgi:hypothetical protein